MQRIKDKLPFYIKQPLKHLWGSVPLTIRYGRVFHETYRFLQKSQYWNRKKLEDYQMQQIESLLVHAYENVPHYRRIFDERDIDPKDIRSVKDLCRLPFLSKDDFRDNFVDFLAKNRNFKELKKFNTSGTSGKPLQFYWDINEIEKERAFVFHLWSRVGYRIGDARVQLRGAVINEGKPYAYDPLEKVLRLSPRIEGKDTAKIYLDKIRLFGAKFLHGYPSAIAQLAFVIKTHQLPVRFQFRAVLFASETVYPWQRQIVEEVFRCRVYSFYGMSEHVVMAGESENSNDYECVPQYGITEIDPETHEIIGTGFLNYANPFIRYKTTDVAYGIYSEGEGNHKSLRHNYPTFQTIEGRLEDFIISSKGVLISPAVITHPFKNFTMIKYTQIIQKDIKQLIINIIPCDNCKDDILYQEIQSLIKNLKQLVGQDMKIETILKDEIELTKAGKIRWIISDVSKDILKNGLHQKMVKNFNGKI